jgi:hypothetical protein
MRTILNLSVIVIFYDCGYLCPKDKLFLMAGTKRTKILQREHYEVVFEVWGLPLKSEPLKSVCVLNIK